MALWQARYVASCLKVPAEIIIIKTQGDAVLHLTLDKVEGKGFFTKEIEAALLENKIDLAVHSFKDLPVENTPGLAISAVPQRGPVRDVLVGPRTLEGNLLRALPPQARVGTSSLRRKAQLLSLRSDLQLVDLRGNVPTRFSKVSTGALDAVVLAEAGLERLQISTSELHARFHPFSVDEMCPAPAQGALAIQTRDHDKQTQQALAHLHHPTTARAVNVERALLQKFGGGCHLPLGAFCEEHADNTYHLRALVASPTGDQRLHAEAQGTAAVVVGNVFESLVKQGAERYL